MWMGSALTMLVASITPIVLGSSGASFSNVASASRSCFSSATVFVGYWVSGVFGTSFKPLSVTRDLLADATSFAMADFCSATRFWCASTTARSAGVATSGSCHFAMVLRSSIVRVLLKMAASA